MTVSTIGLGPIIKMRLRESGPFRATITLRDGRTFHDTIERIQHLPGKSDVEVLCRTQGWVLLGTITCVVAP